MSIGEELEHLERVVSVPMVFDMLSGMPLETDLAMAMYRGEAHQRAMALDMELADGPPHYEWDGYRNAWLTWPTVPRGMRSVPVLDFMSGAER